MTTKPKIVWQRETSEWRCEGWGWGAWGSTPKIAYDTWERLSRDSRAKITGLYFRKVGNGFIC